MLVHRNRPKKDEHPRTCLPPYLKQRKEDELGKWGQASKGWAPLLPPSPPPPSPGASYRSRQGWRTWRCTDGRKWSIRRGRRVNKTRTTVKLNRREKQSRGGKSHAKKYWSTKAGATLVVDREAPCSGPLAKAEEEIPAQEVAPDTQHGTETAVRSDADVGDKSSRSWHGLSRHSQLKDVKKQTRKQFKTFSKHKIEKGKKH